MTIALGVNFGSYIILAADTRTSWYSGDKITHYQDDSEKIQKTKFGLITGAGRIEKLDLVKKSFFNSLPNDTHEMLNLIREALVHYKDRWEGLIPTSKTRWIFSYQTIKNDEQILRLAFYDPHEKNDIAIVNNTCEPLIIFPAETNEEEADALRRGYLKLLKPIEKFKNMNESSQYNTELIANFFYLMHPRYESMSNLFQIGIHKHGYVAISQIVDPTKPQNFNLEFLPLWE